MDEPLACLMSDLLAQEYPRAVLQVDMVGCEHTDCCMAVKYCNSQCQHTIGQKQTEKCQLVDVRFAKIAKDVQKEVMPDLRMVHRAMARRAGVAPTLMSKQAQTLYLATMMHAGLEKDAREHNGVIKAARSAGMLHWLPTSTGLRRADGPEWSKLTSGSSRLPAEAWNLRESWVEEGRPALPDWGRLRELQKRLQQEAQELVAARYPAAASTLVRDAQSPESALTCFKDLDPAGYGEPVFSEHRTRELCPCIPGISLADLYNNAGLLALMHPRTRRQLWREALERVATPAVRTKASKRAVKKDCRMLRREAIGRHRDGQKRGLRAMAADAGVAAARASLVPESGKRKRSAASQATGAACKKRKQARKDRKKQEATRRKGGKGKVAAKAARKAGSHKGGAGKLARLWD